MKISNLRRKVIPALLASSLVAGGTVTAISMSVSASPAAAASCRQAPHKKIAIIDLLAASPIDFLTDQATEAAANELGWSYTFVDSGYNAATANAAILAAVAAHDDLIVTTSWDASAISQGLAAAAAAHIPVVETAAGNLPSNKFAAMYNEDETIMGRILAKYIVKHVPNANIMDLWTNANYAGTLRENAVKYVFAHTPGAKIGYSVNANLTAPQANVQAALAADPTINAAYLIFDNMNVAAAAELRTLNRTNVKIYGYFTEDSNLALMRSGQIAALATDNLQKTGIVAVDQFLKVATKHVGWDKNAVAKAGGLQYTVVTNPHNRFSLTRTIAPFIKSWHSAGYCTYGIGTLSHQ